jgi:hypothetical protein
MIDFLSEPETKGEKVEMPLRKRGKRGKTALKDAIKGGFPVSGLSFPVP